MRVAIAIRDDLNTKNQRVLKAADMVENQRIEWDKNLKAIPAALCPYAAQRPWHLWQTVAWTQDTPKRSGRYRPLTF